MLTLQEVLDLQKQNKITITISNNDNGRYSTLRAYTKDAEQYYVNEYCLFVNNFHYKNYQQILDKIRTTYPNSPLENNLLAIDGRLYLVKAKFYTENGEEEIKLVQLDGEHNLALLKKGRNSYSGETQIRRALNKLVFSVDSYPFGILRKYRKPRKYRKSEIQTSDLSQDMKDRLCRLHDKYFVLFSQEGEYIGLFPREDETGAFELNEETVQYINETLNELYGEKSFEVTMVTYDEKLLTEGVELC